MAAEYIKLSKLAPAGLNYAGRTATVSGFGKVEDDGAYALHKLANCHISYSF